MLSFVRVSEVFVVIPRGSVPIAVTGFYLSFLGRALQKPKSNHWWTSQR